MNATNKRKAPYVVVRATLFLLAVYILFVLANWMPGLSKSPIWHLASWAMIVLMGIWVLIGFFCPWQKWIIDSSGWIPGPLKPSLIQGILLLPFILFLYFEFALGILQFYRNNKFPND